MKEIIVKLDVPSELEEKLEIALEKALKNLEREIKFSLADELLKNSKLTDEQIKEMAEEAEIKHAKKLGLKVWFKMLLPSSLILDANTAFSFFKHSSVRKKIIKKLLDKGVKLIAPSFIFEEIYKNREKIKKFSGISDGAFSINLSLLHEFIFSYTEESYSKLIPKVSSLAPHNKDVSYFALSLSLNNCPIWSDEKAFRKQDKIKIFSTEELLKFIK